MGEVLVFADVAGVAGKFHRVVHGEFIAAPIQQPIESFNWSGSKVTPVAEFREKNGERLARQAPMEKQRDRFRQNIIAQGNDPEKVPRWTSDMDGNLPVGVSKEMKVSDISELRGVAVTKFTAFISSLRDPSPLADAPLPEVTLCPPCGVTDISPLRDAPMEALRVDAQKIGNSCIRRTGLSSTPGSRTTCCRDTAEREHPVPC